MHSDLRFILLSFILLAAMSSARAEFPAASDLPQRKTLPEALVMFDGTPVATAQEWEQKRKPELKQLFQHYMYGYFPEGDHTAKAEVTSEDKTCLGGKATCKQVTLRFGPEKTPPLNLLVVIPNKREGRVPVFVGMNFRGNHTLLDDPKINLPTSWIPDRGEGVKDNKATDAARGTRKEVWSIEQTIDHGYAVATFYAGDVDPDKPDFSDGVHPHFLKAGQEKLGPHDWGTICAWAFGIHRAVDYLHEDDAIDTGRIACVGHSRNGKTALLAAAFDDRIDLAIPHQAGCGGTSLSTHPVGESVKQINDRFPHWFNDTFCEFNEALDTLPFDQHCLIALCAPRPVLASNAVEDQWADPAGQFLALQGADPVYKLLKSEGLAAEKMPELEELVSSPLGYYIRPGSHSMTPGDWRVFYQFADKHFGRK